MSLEAFGVRNLRCLADTGLVPIRPITLLVGQNSSGKSTFLRAFPLLRQSVETARNSPILWNLERYVDFGSLKNAANDRLSEPSVTFRFLLRLPDWADVALADQAFDIAMTLAGGEIPYVSGYELRLEGHEVRWDFDAHGRVRAISADSESLELEKPLSLRGKARLLPTVQLQIGESLGVSYQAAPEHPGAVPIGNHPSPASVLQGPLNLALRTLLDGSTPERISNVAFALRLGSADAMLAQLLALSNQGGFQASTSALHVDNDDFKRISSRVLVCLSPLIIEAADVALAEFMSRVAYLRPLRVNPERAYRIQNLAVEQVDPDGNNLAMFLRSLSAVEAQSFATFTRAALGFETRVRSTELHAEILVRAGAGRLVNLIDVGFGYSEVLPLAAVLWAGCIRPGMEGREPTPLIAIEQPELHLHPAHQARLARMLVEATTKSVGGTKIIVETHSESLINGLGKLVYEGLIKANDVQIVLFDQDDETEQTTVQLAGYRENGALHDWPYGFLSPVARRRTPSAAAE